MDIGYVSGYIIYIIYSNDWVYPMNNNANIHVC